MEPATDELKLALMSLFGYDFLYIELEFVESIDDDEPIRDWRRSFLFTRFGDGALLVLTEYRSIVAGVFLRILSHANFISHKRGKIYYEKQKLNEDTFAFVLSPFNFI